MYDETGRWCIRLERTHDEEVRRVERAWIDREQTVEVGLLYARVDVPSYDGQGRCHQQWIVLSAICRADQHEQLD